VLNTLSREEIRATVGHGSLPSSGAGGGFPVHALVVSREGRGVAATEDQVVEGLAPVGAWAPLAGAAGVTIGLIR